MTDFARARDHMVWSQLNPSGVITPAILDACRRPGKPDAGSVPEGMPNAECRVASAGSEAVQSSGLRMLSAFRLPTAPYCARVWKYWTTIWWRFEALAPVP